MKNRLATSTSPYLLQHASNPVDWYPWGEEAFEKARAEQKPIFLSIGYSTCYWCHMMAKETFAKRDVALALGDFVAIKVDREEHPEVDEIYMDAVVAMTGQGGWPMSVFLTPDLKPFWGGTYIPHENFLQLLGKISGFWKDQRAQLVAGARSVMESLERRLARGRAEGVDDAEVFSRFESQCTSYFDAAHGGFGRAPKFPSPFVLRLLLRLGGHRNLAMATRTLEAMASGGIYDQVGGGFHRYSTDEKWLVPHFEKMLSDNALLAFTYAEAYQSTRREIFAGVARETLDYLLRDLISPEGAFYAAEDAGEVKREGEFYTWRFEELRGLEGLEHFSRLFPVSEAGNFEHGRNVLHLAHAGDWEESRSGSSQAFRAGLFALRAGRTRPHRDEKILTGWNGLAIAALAYGGSVLGEERFIEAAVRAASWMREKLWQEGSLLRVFSGGEARLVATAADYAYLIDGLIHLYQATFNTEWLVWARDLQQAFDTGYWDKENGGYFTAERYQQNLVIRKKDSADGALPAPSSVACANLIRLGEYFLEPELMARARSVLDFQRPLLEKSPLGLAAAGLALFLQRAPSVLVVGGASERRKLELVRQLRGHFLPRLSLGTADGLAIPVLSGKDSKQDCVGYLCKDNTCLPPMPAHQALEILGA